MVLIRPDSWVWDLWIADTGTEYHLFYLTAPRGLVPDDRHRMARVAHAVSTDLRSWTDLGDALTPSEGPAFDDLATWTGSTVRDDDGLWHTFYTGLSRRDDGMVQRIGAATSKDLVTWTKRGPEPLVVADARWYHQWSPGPGAGGLARPLGGAGPGRRRVAHVDHRDGPARASERQRCAGARVVSGPRGVAGPPTADRAGFGVRSARGPPSL